MAIRQILPEQTLETLRTEFNALAADDFGDIATLDASMSATSVIGAVNELAGQIFSAAGWKMEDSSSTIQTVGSGQTARFYGSSNQINAIVSVPDTLTLSLTDDVTLVTSLTAPTVNAGNLSLSSGYITDSSGYVNFDNENIVTTAEVNAGTGTFGTIVGTGATHTLGTIQISGNKISSTDSTTVDINDDLQVLGNIRVNIINPLSGGSVRFAPDVQVDGKLYLRQASSTDGIEFEGATNNSFKTNLKVVDPTGSRVATFPDLTGNVILDTSTGYGTGSIFTATSTLIIYNSAGVVQKTIVGSAS